MTTFQMKDSQSNVVTGLCTCTHTASSTAMYRISVRTTIPPSSGLSIVINQNGSPIATSSAPEPLQLEVDLQIQFSATSGDLFSIVLSSSAPADQNLNVIKSIIVISRMD